MDEEKDTLSGIQIPYKEKIVVPAKEPQIQEDAPIEKKVEEPQEIIEQNEGWTNSQKVGLGVAIAMAILGFFTNSSAVIVTSICSICALAAIGAIIMKKLDIKYSWAITGVLFTVFLIIGLYNAPDSDPAKTWVEKKEAEYAAEKQNKIREEANKKDNIKNKIKEEAYDDGCSDAYGAVETVQDLIRSGYTKENIRGMQKTQGRLNYKDKYGNPKNSEENALMELYGEKFAEGFMKTMFKN